MYQYISPQRAKLCRINSFVPGNGGKLNSDLLDWKKSSVLKRRKSAVLGSAGLIGLPATPNSHAATAVSTVAALLAVAAAEGDNAKALLSLILLLLLRRRSRPGAAPPDCDRERRQSVRRHLSRCLSLPFQDIHGNEPDRSQALIWGTTRVEKVNNVRNSRKYISQVVAMASVNCLPLGSPRLMSELSRFASLPGSIM